MAKTAALAKATQQSSISAKETPAGNDGRSGSPARHALAEIKMDLREAERAALAARAPVARRRCPPPTPRTGCRRRGRPTRPRDCT